MNTISHKQLESLALDWILGYGKIGTNAHQRLKGLSEGEDRRHYALGKDGAAAVLGAAYERFRIRVAQDDIVVEAVTRAGHRRRMTTSSREADDVFEALGINGHLQQKEPGADEIRRYAIRLAQERAHDVLVFEEMKRLADAMAHCHAKPRPAANHRERASASGNAGGATRPHAGYLVLVLVVGAGDLRRGVPEAGVIHGLATGEGLHVDDGLSRGRAPMSSRTSRSRFSWPPPFLMTYAIRLAARGRYRAHRNLQAGLVVAGTVAVLLLEGSIRYGEAMAAYDIRTASRE